MGITATLAKLSAIYQSLSKVDNKTYGFKNGEFFEVVSSGGGGTDDGVTKANFLSKFQSYDVVHRLRPSYLKDLVGFGMYKVDGSAMSTNLSAEGCPFAVSGTASDTSALYSSSSVHTGTTSTGNAKLLWVVPLYNESAGNRYNKYTYSSQINLSANPQRKIIFTGSFYVTNLSDATNTYTALLSFGGPGPLANVALAATNQGIHLAYDYSINSGNYVIRYRNTAGTLVSVNTSVPVGTIGAITFISVVQDRETGSLTVSLAVGLAAPTVYTITDYADGDTYPLTGYIGVSILKSAGTTSRVISMLDVAIGMTFA